MNFITFNKKSRIMKKILFLFLLAGLFTLSSCSNDDDGTNNSDDPIIGTWILTEASSASTIIDPNACEEDSSITFNEDNSGSGAFYLEANECEPLTSSGSWENVEGSDYTVELPPPFGRQQGEVQFPTADQFTFMIEFSGIPITLTFDRQE